MRKWQRRHVLLADVVARAAHPQAGPLLYHATRLGSGPICAGGWLGIQAQQCRLTCKGVIRLSSAQSIVKLR